MRIWRWSALALGTILSSGCLVLSVHPLYTDETLTIHPGLVGTWVLDEEDPSPGIWSFRQEEGKKRYELIYTDNQGIQGTFEAHLVELGEHLFLDLIPDGGELADVTNWLYSLQLNRLYFLHLFPAHSFFRVTLTEGQLSLTPMDLEWLEERVKNSRVSIDHIWTDNRLVMTAKPRQLQRFVARWVQEAFTEPLHLHMETPVGEKLAAMKQRLNAPKIEKKQKEGSLVFHPIRGITAITAGSQGRRFVEFDLMVETRSEDAREQMVEKENQIRDDLITYFNGRTVREIATREFQLIARGTVLSIINGMLEGVEVDTVFFTTFLIK